LVMDPRFVVLRIQMTMASIVTRVRLKEMF
jgi:hypothetical protein